MTPAALLGLVFLTSTLGAAITLWPQPGGDDGALLRSAGDARPGRGLLARLVPLVRRGRRGWGGRERAEPRRRWLRRAGAAARPAAGPFATALDRPVPRRLAERLRRADWLLQPHEFVALTLASGILGAVAGLALGRGPAVIFIGALAGVWLPHAVLDARAAARLKQFETQLPDALDIIANALRSGTSFLQAMDVVARELPSPIGREFDLVVRECRVDIPLEDALQNLVERVPSGDLDLAVTAVLIQRQVGGNLAEVLDIINHTIRERMRIHGEIRTLTAQGRLSGWIVGVLPVGLAFVLHVFNPEYVAPLYTTGTGRLLLFLGLGMQLTGIAVIRRLVRLEV